MESKILFVMCKCDNITVDLKKFTNNELTDLITQGLKAKIGHKAVAIAMRHPRLTHTEAVNRAWIKVLKNKS